VARRKLRVCGTCSAVAIKCVTKIELGRGGCRREACDHCAEVVTGTSATQAGFASATTPSSIVCSGRPLLDIANLNPAELSRFGTLCPLQFLPRKGHADSSGFVPGGSTTWFPEYLRVLRKAFSGTGGPVCRRKMLSFNNLRVF
jgi:hypothetical protein